MQALPRLPQFKIGAASVLLFLAGCGVQANQVTLTSSSGAITLTPGSSQAVTVQVASPADLGEGALITVTGLPSGVTVSPSQLKLNRNVPATLTFSAALNAAAGSFPATDPANPDSMAATAAISASFGPWTSSSPLNLTVSLENPSFVPTIQCRWAKSAR